MAAKRTPFGSQIWHRFHLEVLPFISTSFLTTKTKQKKMMPKSDKLQQRIGKTQF
jgi:hypothetical protein